MNLFLENGYVNVPMINGLPYPFVFCWGGRATGKTYGALWEDVYICCKIFYFISCFSVFYFTERRFQKSVFIYFGIASQRSYQTDVRTFRRFNRAKPAVMCMVNIADFKAGAFSVKTAGA